ncbi:unnamed protein product [Gongylonema pulchrum]|uniref:WD_REPEATS_REGION domain-containing protein n=1 Tax=Gongylonema pulchrum TaxID=637853 RepID=A0A183ECW4_9BILA|nr:unnamed protein product [Gongylonema pulchrum]
MLNSELLDKNFGVCFPEELDGVLDTQQGSANCCKFNRWGSLVASWLAHGYAITALSWSRDGRKLLTAGNDFTVATWDVLEGSRIERQAFGSPIISAMFNPRNDKHVLVIYLGKEPVLMDFTENPYKERFLHGPNDDQAGEITAATFDRRGKYIVMGSSRGRIIVHDAKILKLVTYVKQNVSHQIKNILLTRRGDFLLTNSQDRIIRTYRLDDLLKKHHGTVVEPLQKLQDIINRVWFMQNLVIYKLAADIFSVLLKLTFS